MIWLLPAIVVGGLFYPVLGYLVLAMMVILLVLSAFKGRYWCAHLCPRGAFLDIVMSRASFKRPLPGLFIVPWFRWLVFGLLMVFLTVRLAKTGGDPVLIGAVFVGMCLLTTIIAVLIAVFTKHRGWCAICPMGTLQDKIARTAAKGKK